MNGITVYSVLPNSTLIIVCSFTQSIIRRALEQARPNMSSTWPLQPGKNNRHNIYGRSYTANQRRCNLRIILYLLSIQSSRLRLFKSSLFKKGMWDRSGVFEVTRHLCGRQCWGKIDPSSQWQYLGFPYCRVPSQLPYHPCDIV